MLTNAYKNINKNSDQILIIVNEANFFLWMSANPSKCQCLTIVGGCSEAS